MLRQFINILSIPLLLCTPINAKVNKARQFPTPQIKTSAKQAVVIHFNSGEVIYSKNHNKIMAPSSMAKISLIYLALQKLKRKQLKLDDTILVSRKAYKQIGTRMFLKLGERVNLKQLMLGVGVVSGNDASISLANILSGDTEICGQQMTLLARELGAKQTLFFNPGGIPEPNQVYTPSAFEEYIANLKAEQILPLNPKLLQVEMLDISNHAIIAHAAEFGGISTAYDLALIFHSLLTNFPQKTKHYLGLKKFSHNKIKQFNKLLGLINRFPLVDCGKTGFTNLGGYGISASSFDPTSKERYIVVVNGCRSQTHRAVEAEKLLRFAHLNFKSHKIATAGQVFAKLPTWGGNLPEVEVVSPKNLVLSLPCIYIHHKKSYSFKIEYDKLIIPPVKQGQQVGKIHVEYINHAGELVVINHPLVVKNNVKKNILVKRLWQYAYYLLFGRNPGSIIKKS